MVSHQCFADGALLCNELGLLLSILVLSASEAAKYG